MIRHDKIVEKLKSRVKRREEREDREWKEERNQEAVLELLKNHLTWEHGYNPLKLEDEPQEFLCALADIKDECVESDEYWLFHQDKLFLDDERDKDE